MTMTMMKKSEHPTSLQMLLGQFEKIHLDVDDLAKLMNMKKQSVFNAINGGWFPIKTFKKGKARVADIRDVAEYLDRAREEKS